MPADLEVYNDSGIFLLSSSSAPVVLTSKRSISVTASRNIMGRSRVTVPFSPNGSFIGMQCPTAHAGHLYISHTSTSITLEVFTEVNSGTNTVNIYTFEPRQVGSRDRFGIELFNEKGELTFSSSNQNVVAHAYRVNDTSNIALPSRGETIAVIPLNPITIRHIHQTQRTHWEVCLAKTTPTLISFKSGYFEDMGAGVPGNILLHGQKIYALALKVFS